MTSSPPERLSRAYQTARAALLAQRSPAGYWVGELSTSALSTAVAVCALSLVDSARHASLITAGLRWLAQHQNPDGGWGDTVKSLSNISTTMLCRAAFHLTGQTEPFAPSLQRCQTWLADRYGSTPAQLAEAVRARYGTDRTFSVPILMTSALAGLVPWSEVPPLPFELACLPQSWYRLVRLPVVSYALPALIAIGQAVYHHRRSWNPLRRLALRPSLRVLQHLQPSNGGFLEATPLTSFVALALSSTGKSNHPVVRKCVDFIVSSHRADGSWPIDTNLATWVTTLSINALAAAGDLTSLDRKDDLESWLLRQQYRHRHPYTGADPGGFAWTPLPGGVPDADDTPGAILALCHLQSPDQDPWPGWDAARSWLLSLQNRDGGWPTFCRGWGKLPFDRSGTDLTAHVLRALVALEGGSLRDSPAFQRGLAYLARSQRPDGSWLPLWFGNQFAPDDINPTYGTARVLAAYRDLGLMTTDPARRAVSWLVAHQNDDGGWGGCKGTPSSVEETALAVEVLLATNQTAALQRGLDWLITAVEQGRLHEPTPIGFYFAKLWYFEKLYPLTFAVAALGRALRCLAQSSSPVVGQTSNSPPLV